MKYAYVAALSLLGTVALVPAARADMLTGRVVDILGGDNILVDLGGELVNVDLAYIRPPAGGNLTAAEYLEQLLPTGSYVQIDVSWVSASGVNYGYVYSGGELVNAKLLAAGVSGNPWTVPNPAIREVYQQALSGAPPVLPPLQGAAATAGGGLPWGPVGLGTLALMSVVVAAKSFWGRSSSPRVRFDPRREIKSMQESLLAALTTQKQLERQYTQAQEQVDEWMQRAELALRNNDEELAREALTRKRSHAETAQQLKQSLDEATAEADSIRASMNSLSSSLLSHGEA